MGHFSERSIIDKDYDRENVIYNNRQIRINFLVQNTKYTLTQLESMSNQSINGLYAQTLKMQKKDMQNKQKQIEHVRELENFNLDDDLKHGK